MSAEQDLANANVQIANLISEVTRFRDAAMGINNIWPTITEGRNNTADGKYFSVPGDGAYLKLYRRAGTSQTLIAEFPDRAQVQSLIDVLGGRGVVGGSGDLMAEGAYGLGAAGGLSTNLPNNDLDSVSDKTRLFRYDANTLNRPPSLGAGTGIAAIWAGGEQTQTLVDHFPDSVRGQQWTRAYRAGSWGPMRKQYDSHNILGVVSQSGGTPTGAVFERGSNSFWEWTKYADGRMIAFARITHVNQSADIPDGNAFRTNNYVPPDLPSGFIGIPTVATEYRAQNTTNTWGASAGGGSSQKIFDSYRFLRPSPSTGLNLIACFTVIGNWY